MYYRWWSEGVTVALNGGEAGASRGRVLIADDDDELREVLKIWGSDAEWHVLEAESGKEALEQLDDSVDVLVLDRKMPDLSGQEVLEQLHETSFRGPVVVVSAYRPDEHLETDDVEAYLTKPVKREQFVRHLQQSVQ